MYLKWIIGITILVIILTIAFPFHSIHLITTIFERSYNKQDLIYNFNENQNEIFELKKFVRKEIKDSCWVYIEVNKNKIPIFWVKTKEVLIQKRDLKFESHTTDTMLQKIGWSKSTLLSLRNKLKAANCISIRSGEPGEIGFKRNSMGKYYYMIFDNPIRDLSLATFDRGCAMEVLNNRVVLAFNGGSIGPSCGKGFKQQE